MHNGLFETGFSVLKLVELNVQKAFLSATFSVFYKSYTWCRKWLTVFSRLKAVLMFWSHPLVLVINSLSFMVGRLIGFSHIHVLTVLYL